MGIVESVEQRPPPPVILVPPLFRRELLGRNRMCKPAYDVLFSKLERRQLFEEYFSDADHLLTRFRLQPPEDPLVDIMAQVGTSYSSTGEGRARVDETEGKASFRMQRADDDPYSFVDVRMASSPYKRLRARGCYFDPGTGVGMFACLPLITKDWTRQASLGVRYGTPNFSVGAAVSPLSGESLPSSAWVLGRAGNVTLGARYALPAAHARASWGPSPAPLTDPRDWSFAASYGVRGPGLLTPAFEFAMEVLNSSTVVASYFHHLVVQRTVKNPFEADEVVGITNYIDLGFEIRQSFEDVAEEKSGLAPPHVQLAASWQINKNILCKGRVSSQGSALLLAFKSWWQPSVTCALSLHKPHKLDSQPRYGAFFSVENFGGVRYERADPNYRMLTPTKQHVADEIAAAPGNRPFLREDLLTGRYSKLPEEWRPPAHANVL